jgi:two-component system, NarL family, response regulator NreC
MLARRTNEFSGNAERKRHRRIKILMIDDHPSQIEGYKVILSYNDLSLDIEATPCYTCEEAYRIINSGATCFDLIFLDENMPAYREKNILTGIDLVNVIHSKMPKSKLVVITSHSQAFLLYNIAKKIEPAGILVKSDFKAEELLKAFDTILRNNVYYSETVHRSIKELLSKETYLDSFNRQIITLLSKGIRTKNMPGYLHLSLSAIEKRKAQVKDYFCIDKGTDEDIVREARNRGFI